jgi:TolB-like protein/Tfp pilus assembly protein PilF
VLYELIAGRPPFVGATTTDVIISIVQQEPEPLARCAPAAPHELEQIVAKALGKEPQERYQTATELLAALKGLKLRLEHETKSGHAAGVAARRSWSWRKVAGAAVIFVLLLGAWLWLARRKPEAAPVIAVLPFKNLSAEPESEYFVDGLTDEIIRNLSLIEGLEVRSRTSSFAFKNKQPNMREVGEQLKANWVLEGSVLRAGGRLRINTSFVRVADEFMLWDGAFEKELKDIFAIQDEISRSIVNGLRLKLGRGKRRYDTNPETYELYLKACSLLGLWPMRDPNANKSAELFEQVIAKDPAFAPAYAGLADAYVTLSSPVGVQPLGQLDRETVFARVRPAAERALQLDPLLAEAHAAMGLVYAREMDCASAEKAFRHATALNPNLTAAYLHLANEVLCPTGRIEEALQEIDKAIKADPLSADPWEFRAPVLLNAGRYDEAIESCHRALAIRPEKVLVRQYEARALLQKGRAAEAIAILERFAAYSGGQLGYAYAVTGRRAEAEALATKNANFPNRLAFIYAGLGDKDRVFEALEAMAARNDPRVQIYLGYPELALLRDGPRLAAFRKQVGLQ